MKNSSIYWHSAVSNGHANQIGGAIRDAWGRVGWETGYLGYPRTREFAVSGGRANHMVAGSIYWSNGTGAHNVWLGIRDHWAASGYETGRYGFPTEDTRTSNCSVWAQDFQGGTALYKEFGLNHPDPDGENGERIEYIGGYDSVQDTALLYENQPGFLFGPEMAQSAADWNALGAITITDNFPALLDPGIKVSSPDRLDNDYIGLWTGYDAGPGWDTLEISASWAQGKPSADITAVLNHELGHALGIGHTCGADLMAASGSIDKKPMGLARDLYHHLWGF